MDITPKNIPQPPMLHLVSDDIKGLMTGFYEYSMSVEISGNLLTLKKKQDIIEMYLECF